MIEDEIRAFPRPMVGSGTTGATAEQDGMTLRDWFAGRSIDACAAAYPNVKEWQLKKWFGDRTGIYAEEIIARMAYDIADAMIKARET